MNRAAAPPVTQAEPIVAEVIVQTSLLVRQPSHYRPPRVGVQHAARVTGAAFLVATALIHLHLYRTGYSGIPTIGRLFLANVVGGLALAVAVLLAPVLPPRFARLGRLAAVGGALFEAGTLVGLVVTVTQGLFGFQATSSAPGFMASIVVEDMGAAALTLLALLPAHRQAGGL